MRITLPADASSVAVSHCGQTVTIEIGLSPSTPSKTPVVIHAGVVEARHQPLDADKGLNWQFRWHSQPTLRRAIGLMALAAIFAVGWHLHQRPAEAAKPDDLVLGTSLSDRGRPVTPAPHSAGSPPAPGLPTNSAFGLD